MRPTIFATASAPKKSRPKTGQRQELAAALKHPRLAAKRVLKSQAACQQLQRFGIVTSAFGREHVAVELWDHGAPDDVARNGVSTRRWGKARMLAEAEAGRGKAASRGGRYEQRAGAGDGIRTHGLFLGKEAFYC